MADGKSFASKHWTRILVWSAAYFPALAAELNQGAASDQIDQAFSQLPAMCAEQLAEIYALADGEGENGVGVFFGMTFIPISQIERELAVWDEVIADEVWNKDEVRNRFTSVPDGAVRASYYSKGWIPFARDYGGNYLAVDCVPGPRGKVGQIINYGRDEEIHRILADDLGSFLDWVATNLEAGNFTVIEHPEEPEFPYEFLLKEPDNRHFLDAIVSIDFTSR